MPPKFASLLAAAERGCGGQGGPEGRASIPGRCRLGLSRRELRALRGFRVRPRWLCVDGGRPRTGGGRGAALLREQGRAVSFLTNNSAARSATMQAKLERLGVQAALPEVLTPLEILGEVIDARWGPSRVLVIGTDLLRAIAGRVRPYARADGPIPRGPGGGGRARPGLSPMIGSPPPPAPSPAAPTSHAQPRPSSPARGRRLPARLRRGGRGGGGGGRARGSIVVGKPEPPLFELALRAWARPRTPAAMVGDSVDSDIRGARRVAHDRHPLRA